MALHVYMGSDEFETTHERRQADELFTLLNTQIGNRQDEYYLCYNFSVGGKMLDGALLKKDSLIVFDFKTVGGAISFGANPQNSVWTWKDKTGTQIPVNKPGGSYRSPFSQLKAYRSAVISLLEGGKGKFLSRSRKGGMRKDFSIEHFVKAVVVVSNFDTKQSPMPAAGVPKLDLLTRKWFQGCDLTNAFKTFGQFAGKECLEISEMKRLVENVFGLSEADISDDGHVMTGLATVGCATMTSEVGDENMEFASGAVEIEDKTLPIDVDCDGGQTQTEDCDDLIIVKSGTSGPGKKLYVQTRIQNNGLGDFALEEFSGESVREEYRRMRAKQECPEYEELSSIVVARPRTVGVQLAEIGNRLGRAVEDLDGFGSCHHFLSPQPRVVVLFGKKRTNWSKEVSVSGLEVPKEDIYRDILPAWWRNLLGSESYRDLPLLSVEEVQRTDTLNRHELCRYFKTYAPRSYAEASYLMRSLPESFWTFQSDHLKVLDLGCGTGGATLGIMRIALQKGRAISVTGLDANKEAVSFYHDVVTKAVDGVPNSKGKVTFDTKVQALQDWFSVDDGARYDLIIASKSLGEVPGLLATGAVRQVANYLSDKGVFLLIEIPKHESSIQGISMKTSRLRIEINVGKKSDTEEVVTSVMSR